MLVDLSLREFLDQAANATPTPGGGAVAALAGALGAAMAAMAANYTLDRPKYAAVAAEIQKCLGVVNPRGQELLAGVDADAAAFAAIGESYRLPKDTPAEKAARQDAIAQAQAKAMDPPQGVLAAALAVAETLPDLADKANPNLLSDIEVAAVMLEAAGQAARLNVLVNAKSLAQSETLRREVDQAVARLAELRQLTAVRVAARG
ncbi:MAG: cyclodeaminase/cyclohydrolase family protein [Planctomycetota bacterium]|nr:cyclodeaminase/cyclohydrolase family protein [Planctomycetota bacterium]